MQALVANFLSVPTNYKLVNRFQVKFRVLPDGSGFNGTPQQLQSGTAAIGSTHNPCQFTTTIGGQAGPSNGLIIGNQLSRSVENADGGTVDAPWKPLAHARGSVTSYLVYGSG